MNKLLAPLRRLLRSHRRLVAALLAGAAVWAALTALRPAEPVTVPVLVAARPLTGGVVLAADDVEVRRLPAGQLPSEYLDDPAQAVGRPATLNTPAGAVLLPASVVSRESLAAPGMAVLPVTLASTAAGLIEVGDRIDLIVHIGSLRATTLSASPTPAGMTRRVSDTLDMPMTKLVVQNLEIIRVERDPAPRAAQTQANTREAARPGDVRRLYALVTRDQLEVLSFALRNGEHTFAVRGVGNTAPPAPTDAVTWNDFERWFFAQRGVSQNTLVTTR